MDDRDLWSRQCIGKRGCFQLGALRKAPQIGAFEIVLEETVRYGQSEKRGRQKMQKQDSRQKQEEDPFQVGDTLY